MDILKLFKSTDDGQYILLLEKLWLKQNHEDNDGYTPRPIPENKFKFVFIGKMQEYLSTDYNITSYIGQNLKVDTFKNKYKSTGDFATPIHAPFINTFTLSNKSIGDNVSILSI